MARFIVESDDGEIFGEFSIWPDRDNVWGDSLERQLSDIIRTLQSAIMKDTACLNDHR